MRPVLSFAFTLAVMPTAVAADIEAAFLGQSVYTTAADCPTYKTLAAGGLRSPAAAPTTLTAKGYTSFQGACTFSNVDERYKDRIWTVTLVCSIDGAGDSVRRSEVWRRQPDGSLSITVGKTSTTFVMCATERQSAKKP
jgi:hypothetical protein